MHSFLTKSFSINRLTQSGNKSSWSSVGSGKGFLKPMDDKQLSINGYQYGQGYVLLTRSNVDIQTTDKVVVDSQEYDVAGVGSYQLGSINFKKIILVKDINNA